MRAGFLLLLCNLYAWRHWVEKMLLIQDCRKRPLYNTLSEGVLDLRSNIASPVDLFHSGKLKELYSFFFTFTQQLYVLLCQVKCLRCHHESECYENIMDLSLEIFGWVESLEDALTQFTSPEDLDGENMYRCGRYVSLLC